MSTLTKKDFASDQDVRWCPGCGDYSILAQMQKVLPELGIPKEQIVFISGIGCSSRFPYYMNTYGLHGIHGRAPTIASGLKIVQPELTVFVITGDGDGLSMGTSHLVHALRRNLDLNILLFNNQIYGLTKGQYSPTTELGRRTKSSPHGTVDRPLHPVSLALASEATFVARAVERDAKQLQEVLRRAIAHRGSSFVEIFQNCNIFNDKAFDDFAAKEERAEHTVLLEHGKPLLFGRDRRKGLRLRGLELEVVELDAGGPTEDLLVHDEGLAEPTLAALLGRMGLPQLPVALGVLRDVVRPVYEEAMAEQLAQAARLEGRPDLDTLLRGDDTWRIGDS